MLWRPAVTSSALRSLLRGRTPKPDVISCETWFNGVGMVEVSQGEVIVLDLLGYITRPLNPDIRLDVLVKGIC